MNVSFPPPTHTHLGCKGDYVMLADVYFSLVMHSLYVLQKFNSSYLSECNYFCY